MDILSKDTLALIENAKVREALDELLKQSPGASSSTTVEVELRKPAPGCSDDDNTPSKQVVTLRRLSV